MIGETPLSEYALYSDQPDFAPLASISDKIREIAGVTLPIAPEAGESTIVFTVDDTLRMLEYAVKEKDGILTFSVYTPFALPYMAEIVEAVLAECGAVIPSGFEEKGAYALDEAAGFPENTEFEFAGETNRNPLAYACGEDVTFRISFVCGNRLVAAPAFQYEYRTDDGKTREGRVPGDAGQLVLTVLGSDIPGTAKLSIEAVDSEGHALPGEEFVGGVAFDFDEIAPARPAPPDFEQFWEDQMDKLLASSPEEIEFERCPTQTAEDFDIYDAVVQTPWDPAYLHITVPKDAAEKSLEIKMRYQVYGFDSVEPRCENGTITVSVNAHSIPNDQSDAYYEQQSEVLDCWVSEGDTREDCYFLRMLMRDIQAIRYAEKKFAVLWDGETINVTGGSMGGFQSVAVGALYDKVTSVNTQITWMCDIGGGDAGRNDGWAPSWSEAGQYFDTCYFASNLKCPTVSITAGLGDYISPPSGVIALYNAIQADGTEKKLTLVQNWKHGGNQGAYCRSYRVTGSPASLAEDDHVIRDNGRAAPDP